MSPTVLFIAGSSRSGSTLLDRVLGQSDGVHSLGETVFLWERGLGLDEPCGCGVPFRGCPFWTEVGERAFGGWDRLDLDGVVALQRRVDRTRYVPALLAPALFPRFARKLRAYADVVGRLYRAVADASGASVLVDSSKRVSTALLLRHVPGADPRIVQLVRDPRGVAWSMGKTVVRPEDPSRVSTMHREGAAKAAMDWQLTNGLLWLAVRRRVVRYEDFVAAPRRVAADILRFAGHDGRANGFVDERRVRLGVDHTVSGNPIRFRTGELEIAPDRGWQEQMTPGRRRTVSALTIPTRLAFRS
jgi:Sulfotransferase domain